jgi:hypothetical protein
MDIDVIVALLKRRGFTDTKAKKYAGYILSTSKSIDIPVSELIDNLSTYFTFADLGVSDNIQAHYNGVATGVMKKPKKSILDRNILL